MGIKQIKRTSFELKSFEINLSEYHIKFNLPSFDQKTL